MRYPTCPARWRATAGERPRPGEIHMSDHSGQTSEMGHADGPTMIQTRRCGEALVSVGRHGPPTKQYGDNGAPRSHYMGHRGTSREEIKAVTRVSTGHGLDLLRA